MSSKIFYKISSQEVGPIGEIAFSGQTLRVSELKRQLIERLAEGHTDYVEFDLELTDSERQRAYTDDNQLVPKNATVLVRRVPLANPLHRRAYASAGARPSSAPNPVKTETVSGTGSEDFQDVFGTRATRPSVDNPLNVTIITGANEVKAHDDETAKIQMMVRNAAAVGNTGPGGVAATSQQPRGFARFASRAEPGAPSVPVPVKPKKAIGIPKELLAAPVEGTEQMRIQVRPDETFDQKVKTQSVKSISPEEVRNRVMSDDSVHIPDELRCTLSKELLKEAVRLPCCLQPCSFDKISKALLSNGLVCPLCQRSPIPVDMLKVDKILRDKVNGFLNEVRIRLEKAQENAVALAQKHRENEDVPLPSNNKSDIVLDLSARAKNAALQRTNEPRPETITSDAPIESSEAADSTANSGNDEADRQGEALQPESAGGAENSGTRAPPMPFGAYGRPPYGAYYGAPYQAWMGPPRGPGFPGQPAVPYGWQGPPPGPWNQPPRGPFFPGRGFGPWQGRPPRYGGMGVPRGGGARGPFASGFRGQAPGASVSTNNPPGAIDNQTSAGLNANESGEGQRDEREIVTDETAEKTLPEEGGASPTDAEETRRQTESQERLPSPPQNTKARHEPSRGAPDKSHRRSASPERRRGEAKFKRRGDRRSPSPLSRSSHTQDSSSSQPVSSRAERDVSGPNDRRNTDRVGVEEKRRRDDRPDDTAAGRSRQRNANRSPSRREPRKDERDSRREPRKEERESRRRGRSGDRGRSPPRNDHREDKLRGGAETNDRRPRENQKKERAESNDRRPRENLKKERAEADDHRPRDNQKKEREERGRYNRKAAEDRGGPGHRSDDRKGGDEPERDSSRRSNNRKGDEERKQDSANGSNNRKGGEERKQHSASRSDYHKGGDVRERDLIQRNDKPDGRGRDSGHKSEEKNSSNVLIETKRSNPEKEKPQGASQREAVTKIVTTSKPIPITIDVASEPPKSGSTHGGAVLQTAQEGEEDWELYEEGGDETTTKDATGQKRYGGRGNRRHRDRKRPLSDSEEEQETFAATGADASKTQPIRAGEVKKGKIVLLKGFPCKVIEMTTSKTGKHGHAKANITGIDIFTGKKYEEISPTSHNMEAPVVSTSVYLLTDISEDGFATLLNEDTGDNREDLRAPDQDSPNPELGVHIRKALAEGKDVTVTVTKAMDMECITAFRTN